MPQYSAANYPVGRPPQRARFHIGWQGFLAAKTRPHRGGPLEGKRRRILAQPTEDFLPNVPPSFLGHITAGDEPAQLGRGDQAIARFEKQGCCGGIL